MREMLATLSHEQWSGWMRYLFSQSIHHVDGSVTIPLNLVSRWMRQMATPYDDLSETEKESDRHEADRIIAMLEEME